MQVDRNTSLTVSKQVVKVATDALLVAALSICAKPFSSITSESSLQLLLTSLFRYESYPCLDANSDVIMPYKISIVIIKFKYSITL